MSLRCLFWMVFAVTAATYLVMVLWSLPRLAVDGMFPFDLRPAGYSPEEARAYLSALSADQRAFYAGVQHKLDMLFPALMAASLILAYHLLFTRPVAWLVSPVALAAATFDGLENAAVSNAMALRAHVWTVWKSLTVPLALGIVIAGPVRRWWRKRKMA